MNLLQVATLIPAHYRRLILESNYILLAQAIPGNEAMMVLFTIWKNYVNPGSAMDEQCSKCLGEILGHYKKLQQTFLEMNENDNLLNLPA